MNPDFLLFSLKNPLIVGALTGLGSSLLVDYAAFRSWRSFNEFAQYDWGVAAFRWVQGIVGGIVTAAGIDVVA